MNASFSGASCSTTWLNKPWASLSCFASLAGVTGGPRDVAPFDYAALRSRFKHGNEHGAWMVNNGYTRAMALDVVACGAADLVAFGKPFISNPDLVRRLREDAPLAPLSRDTLYGGGAAGFIDYPPLEMAPA